jgi:peptidoglycan/xylan/chitin deacetylase (PgdA/CDA1 family)
MKQRKGTARRIRNISLGLVVAVAIVLLLSAGMENPQAIQDGHIGELGNLDRDGVPVLCYHYLRDNITPWAALKALGAICFSLPLVNDMDLWTHTRSTFERHMSILHENGYQTVTLEDVVAWQRGQKELPEKSVVITFDDGDRSVYDVAWPVLEKYGFKATVFIVTSHVGKRWGRVNTMSWAELRELHDSGVFAIESHTHALHYKVETPEGDLPVFQAASRDLYQFPDESSWQHAVYKDLLESRRLIKRHLAYDSKFLAWPFGHATGPLDRLAVAAGFDGLCTLVAGKNPRSDYPVVLMNPKKLAETWPGSDDLLPNTSCKGIEIYRYTMTARTSIAMFKQMIW